MTVRAQRLVRLHIHDTRAVARRTRSTVLTRRTLGGGPFCHASLRLSLHALCSFVRSFVRCNGEHRHSLGPHARLAPLTPDSHGCWLSVRPHRRSDSSESHHGGPRRVGTEVRANRAGDQCRKQKISGRSVPQRTFPCEAPDDPRHRVTVRTVLMVRLGTIRPPQGVPSERSY